MTQIVGPSDEGVVDFTERVDVKFRIDDDIFIGVPNIPGKHLIQFATLFDNLTFEEIKNNSNAYDTIFRLVLKKASADLFLARLDDEENPISMTQVMKILPWLMEQYGMRPTEPSPNSPDGQPNLDDGTNSTANASLSASTLATYPQTNS
jgi:hypothetical protein